MRTLVLILALSPGLLADEASKASKVDELLRVMNTKATIDETYGQLAKQMESASAAAAVQYHIPPERQPEMADLSKRLTAILSDQLSWEKMKPVYQKIYADVFDESEIDALLAFYNSSAGQSFVAKTPLILRKSTEAMQSQLPGLMSAIQKATQDFVQEHHLQKP